MIFSSFKKTSAKVSIPSKQRIITTTNKKKLKEGDYICLLEDSNIEYILRNNNIISYELLTLMGDRLLRDYGLLLNQQKGDLIC